MSVYEIYVEKKPEYAGEAASIANDIRLGLQLDNLDKVRIINRYFAEGLSKEDFDGVKSAVFSEPPVDIIYDKLPDIDNARVFAVELLPGQFDQRADSCAQCISLATGKEQPVIRYAKIYALYGNINDNQYERIKAWIINPVESRLVDLKKPDTLKLEYNEPQSVEVLDGFINLNDEQLNELRQNLKLAMDFDDIKFCQNYFKDQEKRDPSITEIRVLDTYWSDHCRHTTFLTELTDVKIEDEVINKSYNNYLELRASLGRSDKPITLMDIATIGVRALKQKELLADLDESEEINACSVKIKVDINGKDEDWLLMFKNETHNHPTEIEPFGGAATCLGGAIRDPLSGRAFVYQAMRITGAGDPLQAAALPGKLPQQKICRTAAEGYSSYGNQIGVAAGHISEIYHPGYVAKRMELGAVIGAAPAINVVRETPVAGDIVILAGGKTGRDGIGGATGSSKSHDTDSLVTCGADVQKGNPPEERKIQRLFRNPQAAKLIKRCNDFGAGGVSVSVGELADGLSISLDKVPVKYGGLDGTELAISESQERMSVVVSRSDAEKFIALADEENLEAVIIAEVTEEPRLVMNWKGKAVVNLCRTFLNSNGAKKKAKAQIRTAKDAKPQCCSKTDKDEFFNLIGSLNICSQKGLVDRFDSSAGAATVLAPFGGKYQLTPAQSMAAKIPVLNGDTTTVSLMSWGFDPVLSSVSPYHGAIYAVVHSLAKIIAAGGSRKKCWLSFQEYFERLRDDPARWGKPLAALLGALDAQLGLEIAAIGGKDSMSGSFENIDVPPTLVSFAVSVTKIDNIITPEFKESGSFVYLISHRAHKETENTEEYFISLCNFFDNVEKLIEEKIIISAWAAGSGGAAEAIPKMCFGNRLGFAAEKELCKCSGFCGFIVEAKNELNLKQGMEAELLGRTINQYVLKTPSFESFMFKVQSAWENTLAPVYPYLNNQKASDKVISSPASSKMAVSPAKNKKSQPLFIIPVFPETNGEYDITRAVEEAGGKAQVFIIRNLSSAAIAESANSFAKLLRSAQGMIIPGGFSGSDEPSGSGKSIAAFLRTGEVSDSIMKLLQRQDGLICGISGGFQALLKLGLVPYGEIRDMTPNSPTLTFNTIGRHQSTLVRTKIISNKSPWLSHLETDEIFIVPVSHGEGRFIANEDSIKQLEENGQIATLYVDIDGNPTQDIRYNPGNSMYAIEGITSPCGRIFGRMAHNERMVNGLYKNIPDIKVMDIFKGAVDYFSA
ncbi:MAG: phosphoribosylformylglycinamidine synthase [Treponema sp.]|jgi:phosphoribosylformylglycinamidine synthase|nr:phosphoribosylformylglycinamidine synthase [Treponema sp.]